jgi:hypothetical protein
VQHDRTNFLRYSAIILLIAAARVTPAAPPTPVIAVSAATEDGKKMLVAKVTVNGKPVEDVTVQFFAARSFGQLALGREKTLDDGTAAVAFPSDLPAGSDGRLNLSAAVVADDHVAPASAAATFGGGTIFPANAQNGELPRELWAPRSPILLIASIAAIAGVVWLTYAYVVYQLIRIRKEGVAP